MVQQAQAMILFDDVINQFRKEQPTNPRRNYFCNSILVLFHSNKKLNEVLSEYKEYQLKMRLPGDVCPQEFKLFMEFARNKNA